LLMSSSEVKEAFHIRLRMGNVAWTWSEGWDTHRSSTLQMTSYSRQLAVSKGPTHHHCPRRRSALGQGWQDETSVEMCETSRLVPAAASGNGGALPIAAMVMGVPPVLNHPSK
jgi:hypothetical protein